METDKVRVLLLKHLSNSIEIDSPIHLSVYGYTDKNLGKLFYTIYLSEFKKEEDMDKVKKYIEEYFGLIPRKMNYCKDMLVYLLEEDSMYGLYSLLKIST